MKWILIATVIFTTDGERYTGPLDTTEYTEQECRTTAKALDAETPGQKFIILAASCITTASI